MRFNSLGEAAYGASTVNVDGVLPAPLVGLDVGKPCWMSDTELVYQDCTAACAIHRLTYPGLTIDVQDSSGANFLFAGGGTWAALLGSDGFARTSNLSVGPFTGGGIADVDDSGRVVVIDDWQMGVGLTVYNTDGSVKIALPTAAIGLTYIIRLRDDLLTYLDAAGSWQIVNVNTGVTPTWVPRTDGVNWLVPITHNGTLYVLERTATMTLRKADSSNTWTLVSTPTTFNPDGISLNATTIRLGSCLDIGETINSLQTFDITFNADGTISVITGQAGGGTITYSGTPTTGSPTVSPVGPVAGTVLGKGSIAPANHPVVERTNKDLITRPWLAWASGVDRLLTQVGSVVQNTPTPLPPSAVSDPAFNEVQSTGQPSLIATLSQTILSVESADGSVAVTLNPATNEIDLATVNTAPADAEYLVAAAHAGLSAERVAIDTATVAWDFTTPGQAKANVSAAAVEALGYWSPLTDGIVASPSLVFNLGDTISIWTDL